MKRIVIPLDLVERMNEVMEEMNVDETLWTWEAELDDDTTIVMERDV